MLKKLLTALAVAGVSITGANAADNQVGNMTVTVELPEVLVLYHWESAHIKFNDNISDVLENGVATKESDLGVKTVDVSGGMNTNPPDSMNTNSKIKVTLENAWAVRSLTANGNVQLKVDGEDTRLVHKPDSGDADDNSYIDVKDAILHTNQAETNDAAIIKFGSKWVPTMGNIVFDLDLTEAKRSGKYKGNSENTLTLTLSTVQN